jgi:thymidylate synthase
MISITSKTANQAWISVIKELLSGGSATGNEKYFRDEPAVIKITDPRVEVADRRFPMKQEDLDVINRYIHSGDDEDKVIHEWTKLYYHRSFDEPNSQIEFLISKLDANNPVGEAQISMWDKNIDQDKKVSPCTQIIWARLKHGRLELHVHTNSTDAYKKLLMNILEFISLQKYIADRVSVPVGDFIMFVDSCHLHTKDIEKINELKDSI